MVRHNFAPWSLLTQIITRQGLDVKIDEFCCVFCLLALPLVFVAFNLLPNLRFCRREPLVAGGLCCCHPDLWVLPRSSFSKCRSTAIKMEKETFWRRPLISSLQWGEMVFQGGEIRSGVKWVILAGQSWTNKQVGEKKWTEWVFPGFKVFWGGLWLCCSIIQL